MLVPLLLPQIYIDAKTGVFDVGKLTELLAKQPQILSRGNSLYVGRIHADEEKERHNKKVKDGLKQLIEMAKKQQTVSEKLGSITDVVITSPDSYQWNYEKTVTKKKPLLICSTGIGGCEKVISQTISQQRDI